MEIRAGPFRCDERTAGTTDDDDDGAERAAAPLLAEELSCSLNEDCIGCMATGDSPSIPRVPLGSPAAPTGGEGEGEGEGEGMGICNAPWGPAPSMGACPL